MEFPKWVSHVDLLERRSSQTGSRRSVVSAIPPGDLRAVQVEASASPPTLAELGQSRI
jgi:hypothetical protein